MFYEKNQIVNIIINNYLINFEVTDSVFYIRPYISPLNKSVKSIIYFSLKLVQSTLFKLFYY